MSEDPRPRLAYDRTLLANEGTFAAWVRTGFSIAAVGLAVRHFSPGAGAPALPWMLGARFVLIGIAVVGFGAWRFAAVSRDLGMAGAPAAGIAPSAVYLLTAVLAALLIAVLVGL
jgi:putative membrane protein